VHLDATQELPARASGAAVNPLLDPRVSQFMVDEFHRARGVDGSYGSYIEDRRYLLRGSYLSATGAYLHLGVDFNVPQGTRVAVVPDPLRRFPEFARRGEGGTARLRSRRGHA
jgi:hypothetical protein